MPSRHSGDQVRVHRGLFPPLHQKGTERLKARTEGLQGGWRQGWFALGRRTSCSCPSRRPPSPSQNSWCTSHRTGRPRSGTAYTITTSPPATSHQGRAPATRHQIPSDKRGILGRGQPDQFGELRSVCRPEPLRGGRQAPSARDHLWH